MVEMVPQPISMPPGLLKEFKEAVKGTRFDKDGTINGSAAVRELIKSVIEDKKKDSAILQPRIEYTTRMLNEFLGCSDEHIAECIEQLPREKIADIGNKINAVSRIVTKSFYKETEEAERSEEEVKNPVTEEEYKQIRVFTSSYYEKPLTPEQKELRRRLRRHGKLG
jgi:metal-responsive CopG/Arc/MetJ family transcriptional regulator